MDGMKPQWKAIDFKWIRENKDVVAWDSLESPEEGRLSDAKKGDIGEGQPNGAMKVTDRKKNIFKLSQGEYVALESIESKYLQCLLITLVLEDWAAEHHLTDD
ncbi:long chain acyl-CoA synthetase 4 isoform X5 [Rosa chinensis]|uniref:long chain acyl-CoA synthetase 4 isoform X5 n=1 Tax=Rosa chinensis TaxID=74649 RepID=UPI001AD931A3|nr:long chain acyl-CoA synthetase 4 isoform X5 [Rosa chinensis]XP_040373417.1 long chain acyl-CoA synthetase 4 isoform X5 [Rosa chinensis]XP_040373432.1 long chain acyl-CoA synthetase 4 isoform X5 [Rosa chinensis]XP_040373467.1 long chain acyl-CoA synthetase 4 isoform X5 [Rosa chinensis]XP_040373501.1 long chain acyl-CoA synthetase 4 isoform X5 [Rosa chinensis]XP_040373525.1 long chain acyl-CoA synthetase 4 isoform X5 [Rosa chinensis]XP_040373546.1 long chain acyl-CoA synthetase 4 isoform X5 